MDANSDRAASHAHTFISPFKDTRSAFDAALIAPDNHPAGTTL
jgi:hypothetical protein